MPEIRTHETRTRETGTRGTGADDMRTPAETQSYDVVLVGGGLANGLIAHRLAHVRPDLRMVMIEAGERIGGNHTWSFHQSDVTAEQDQWLAPLVHAQWSRQEVRFPRYSRVIDTGYRSIASADFHDAIAGLAPLDIITGVAARTVNADAVTLNDGRTLKGACVLDGRGLKSVDGVPLGYQKFVGLEFETEVPHGLSHPIIMDADVEQQDGYRFVYSLPFSPTRILIEDTYYSDTPEIETQRLEARIHAYAEAMGWRVGRIVRSEAGVLPIVLDGAVTDIWPEADGLAEGGGGRATGDGADGAGAAQAQSAPRVGMSSGIFHQTTGYSVARAAMVADAIAQLDPLTSASAARCLKDAARTDWADQSYFRLLNRVIFLGARPHQRRAIFERFYRLSERMIERFYAGHLLTRDKLRLLTGKPPIPMLQAFRAFPPSAARRSPKP